MNISVVTDPDNCWKAWEQYWPTKGLFDLWPVRECFHKAFQKPLHFVLAWEKGKVTGFLPLCWDSQAGAYVMFPGETWQGKTWIEQNRIIAASEQVLSLMLDAVPGPIHLRYLLPAGPAAQDRLCQDEIGYLFYPGLCDYSMDNYWMSFSGKTRKKIRADLNKLEAQGVSFRFDDIQDLDHLFRMNLGVFDHYSYFSDPRFQTAFANLTRFLSRSGMLRVTTVLVAGEVAAVDLGACFKNTYTLLAGGTNPDFPGVAKVINLHHLERACRERFDSVDFLCGDFNWKSRFHLAERPLFQMSRISVPAVMESEVHDRAVA